MTCFTVSPIRFGKSRRATRLDYFIPLQVSRLSWWSSFFSQPGLWAFLASERQLLFWKSPFLWICESFVLLSIFQGTILTLLGQTAKFNQDWNLKTTTYIQLNVASVSQLDKSFKFWHLKVAEAPFCLNFVQKKREKIIKWLIYWVKLRVGTGSGLTCCCSWRPVHTGSAPGWQWCNEWGAALIGSCWW